MALWAAGIAVELREVKLAAKPPQLAQASPKATVPVLVLADGTVIDGEVLCWRGQEPLPFEPDGRQGVSHPVSMARPAGRATAKPRFAA